MTVNQRGMSATVLKLKDFCFKMKIDHSVMQNHDSDYTSVLEKNCDFDVSVQNRYNTRIDQKSGKCQRRSVRENVAGKLFIATFTLRLCQYLVNFHGPCSACFNNFAAC